MVFKIHGERNSGTKFLTNLFEANFKFAPFQEYYINNNCFFWKHGTFLKKHISSQIDIFIIRSLDNWLLSMFNNPYHLNKFSNFYDFIISKQSSSDTWTKDGHLNLPINYEDNDKTILEIRYFKLKKIFDYCNQNSNTIIVSLDYIHNPINCEKFLRDINKIYNLNKNDNYITSIKYIKKNYNINIDHFRNKICNIKNNYIENYISNLTYMIKYSP
jgi:hypothetical protein